MLDMFEINKDVFFVKGAVNGAIYDLVGEKVFSVNKTACEIIARYCNETFADNDAEYLNKLRAKHLIDEGFTAKETTFEDDGRAEIEMAWLEITQTCNLRCLHCYEGTVHKSSGNTLSLNEWKNVIEQLKHLNIKRTVVIGGEPCCHTNLMKILEHILQEKIDVTLFTNGTLLNDAMINFIAQNNIRVKISVYGHCAEIHDKITGVSGSFAKTEHSIKNLTSQGVPVEASVIIMKENQDFLSEIIAWTKENHMQYHRYDTIREIGGGAQNAHAVTNKKTLSGVYMTKPNFKITKKNFLKNLHHNSCWYGKLVITENGDVLPCVFERNRLYGNVRKNSLKNIIESETTRKCWFMDFSKIQICRDCEFRFVCHDCRPVAAAVTGNFCGKNPRCRYDVYSGIWREVES